MEAATLLAKRKDELQIVHQTGKRNYNNVRAAYARQEMQVEVAPFLPNMADRFAWQISSSAAREPLRQQGGSRGPRSDFLFRLGKPDSHHFRNAQEMTNSRAGRLIAEPELNAERLTREIYALPDQPGEIERLATQARSLAHPGAVVKSSI